MTFVIANPFGTGTDEELLAYVRGAIAQIIVYGQAYSIDGRQLTRASLRDLREYEASLVSSIATATAIASGQSSPKETIARVRAAN